MYRVLVWGIGAMGSGIVKDILKKKTLELVGVVETGRKELEGKSLGDYLEVKSDIKISSDARRQFCRLIPISWL